VYVALGPPDQVMEIKEGPNGGVDFPLEQWTYRMVPGIGVGVRVLFIDPTMSSVYKMVPPPEGVAGRRASEAVRQFHLIQDRIRQVLGAIENKGTQRKTSRPPE
jgi:hypothetical protein